MRHRRNPAQSPRQDFEAGSTSKVSKNEFPKLGAKTGSTSLEAWIMRLGVEAEISMKHGRRDAACTFMHMMYAAIRTRSPLQQHRRHLDIDAAIWGPQ